LSLRHECCLLRLDAAIAGKLFIMAVGRVEAHQRLSASFDAWGRRPLSFIRNRMPPILLSWAKDAAADRGAGDTGSSACQAFGSNAALHS
jgi:hypothetical protein